MMMDQNIGHSKPKMSPDVARHSMWWGHFAPLGMCFLRSPGRRTNWLPRPPPAEAGPFHRNGGDRWCIEMELFFRVLPQDLWRAHKIPWIVNRQNTPTGTPLISQHFPTLSTLMSGVSVIFFSSCFFWIYTLQKFSKDMSCPVIACLRKGQNTHPPLGCLLPLGMLLIGLPCLCIGLMGDSQEEPPNQTCQRLDAGKGDGSPPNKHGKVPGFPMDLIWSTDSKVDVTHDLGVFLLSNAIYQ